MSIKYPKSRKNYNALLITAAIDIEDKSIPYTVLTNTEKRLNQYIISLKYAIEHYHKIDTIIFCDNTNLDYDYSNLFIIAEKYNKLLEVLRFRGDYENIQQKGKGYGEGEIINYVLENSKLIHNAEYFYKLTGRILIQNFDKIIKFSKSNHFIFPSGITNSRKETETFFYLVNINFYNNYLKDAYLQTNDKNGIYLEHVFYDRLHDKEIKSFCIYPKVIGISASTGKPYTKKTINFLGTFLLNLLGLYNSKLSWNSKFVYFILKKIIYKNGTDKKTM